MSYLVITRKTDKDGIYQAVQIDEHTFEVEKVIGFVDTANIVSLVYNYSIKPLNFTIDRRGNISESCGNFDRLREGSGIVLAEITTKSGRTIGFRVLSIVNLMIVNLKTLDIVEKQTQLDFPFLQNAIIRNGGVASYPRSPFPRIIFDNRVAKKVKSVKQEDKPARIKKEPVKKVFDESEYTPEQLREIKEAKKNGLDTGFLHNPKLSARQMRVLWVSKTNGAMSEYFANPNLSVDSMKFYADRLLTPAVLRGCSDMLRHPELSVDELSELYLCFCVGVDYSDLIGKDTEEIYVERERRSKDVKWGSLSDIDFYDKALSVAVSLKGYV